MLPVVNLTDARDRLDLNRGNPTRCPARSPLRDFDHASRPRAKASRPVLYASLEFSPHHGATTSLRAFHSLRSDGKVHDNGGVRESSATP
jgi:hypothetical protein